VTFYLRKHYTIIVHKHIDVEVYPYDCPGFSEERIEKCQDLNSLWTKFLRKEKSYSAKQY